MLRLEAIKNFLQKKALPDLASLFTDEMEVQVNVIPNKDYIDKEYAGHKYKVYHDNSGQEWKHIRIPYNTNTSNPEYQDRELRFSTDKFEAIGLTGWNWVQQRSEFVVFDFDSITGHVKGLDDAELNSIRRSVEAIDWITIRRSKSGRGLHLYVFLQPPIETKTHTEHAALGRSILSIISARVGNPLQSKVDSCGGVAWIWHRKSGIDGHQLIKAGIPLTDIPINWKDHLDIITSKRSKLKSPIEGDEEYLNELVKGQKVAKLDDKHRELMGWLASNKCMWWWDHDRQILVAHTFDLKKAHTELKLKGPFYTNSTGKDQGYDQNCFAFPLRNGGWVVRRHTRRVAEHPCWTIDANGWTRCYYNIQGDLATSSRCHGGVERTDGRFEFTTAEVAIGALLDLGAPLFNIIGWLAVRPATLKMHKDGRAILTVRRDGQDVPPADWALSKDGWERIINIQHDTLEPEIPDELVRHLVAEGINAGWYLFVRNEWVFETESNIVRGIRAITNCKNTNKLMDQCVMHPWYLICKPFQPEYPGNRCWNIKAPQFSVTPIQGQHSSWDLIFNHLGQELNEAVENSLWCKDNSITSGSQYLLLWAASLFQNPGEPLPYLFFHSPEQNTGKSTFHEALSLLIKDYIGYIRADTSLISASRFNGELANAVLCIVEEVNLQKHNEAYNRIKDWVTGRTINIHVKGKTPYEAPNNTHWIQCSNDIDACPLFPGDTRIVACRVQLLQKTIPKSVFMNQLTNEAAAFLYTILHIDIPISNERLRIPVIDTAEKLQLTDGSVTLTDEFFRQLVFSKPGSVVSIQECFDSFINWLPFERRRNWTYARFTRTIPDHIIRGKYKNGYYYLGNVSLDPSVPEGIPLKRIYDRLIEVT